MYYQKQGSLGFWKESLSLRNLDSIREFAAGLGRSFNIEFGDKLFSCFAPPSAAIAIIELVLGSAIMFEIASPSLSGDFDLPFFTFCL